MKEVKNAMRDPNFVWCYGPWSCARCSCVPQMTAAETLPSEASAASESASGAESVHRDERVAQDETSGEEKNEVGAEMEEKNESSSDTQARSKHADREAFPTTFDDLCRQMTERANFLLEVIPLT